MVSLIYRNTANTTFVRFDTNLFLVNNSLAETLDDTGITFTVMDIKDRSDAEVVAGLGMERGTYTIADFIAKANSIAGVGLFAVNGESEVEVVAI